MREVVGPCARAVPARDCRLSGMVDRRLALDLDLFSRGGMRVLEKIEQQDYDVLAARPAISKVERVRLLLGSAGAGGVLQGGMRPVERVVRILPRRGAQARPRISTTRSCCCPTPAARRHVRDLRVHALLRRSERRPGDGERERHAQWRAELDAALQGDSRTEPVLAGLSRHGAALSRSRTSISTR